MPKKKTITDAEARALIIREAKYRIGCEDFTPTFTLHRSEPDPPGRYPRANWDATLQDPVVTRWLPLYITSSSGLYALHTCNTGHGANRFGRMSKYSEKVRARPAKPAKPAAAIVAAPRARFFRNNGICRLGERPSADWYRT